jgi:hypothetical protein
MNSRFEDVRCTSMGGRAGRFRKLNWSHRFDFIFNVWENIWTVVSVQRVWRMDFLEKTRENFKESWDSGEKKHVAAWEDKRNYLYFFFLVEKETERLRPMGQKKLLIIPYTWYCTPAFICEMPKILFYFKGLSKECLWDTFKKFI